MRISTQAASFAALNDLMRAQRDQFEAGKQVSSGLKAPDLKGYGTTAETITAARSALKRTEGFVTNTKRLDARMQVQDLAMRELSEAASDLRIAMTTGDGTYLMTEVRDAFERARIALNTKFNGAYVFAGVRTDVEPFSAESLADLQAAPAIADVFENADRRQTAKIDEDSTLEVGPLASELGEDLMAIFERVADYDAGPNGPFNGPVTPAQQTFLQAEIGNAITAFERINDHLGANGAAQSRVEATRESHETRTTYLNEMLAELEDVDMAEAATRFTQAQNAVQVSAATFSRLSQLSLLPFLR
mgnify:CR=1 FL=1